MGISSEKNNQNQISLQEFQNRVKSIYIYLRGKRVKIFFAGVFGGIVGLIIAIFTPVKFYSKITFVVEETKSGGGLSSLAGQFGFDLGSSSSASIFSGDNILLFLRSENLCREALLTPYDDTGNLTLIDKYAEVKGFKSRWKKNKKIGDVNFAKFASGTVPRKEDSLLQILIKKYILLDDLSVSKPDKKASFIQVIVSTQDEKLSALFSQRLVNIASNKYVESKTKFKLQNVNILQKRADSLSNILNYKTYRAAASQQSLVDMNPALKTSPISTEISTREKNMVATMFAEVIKNLELSKSILSQETPAIQIIDQSTFPLERFKPSKLKGIISWGLFLVIIYVFYLLLSKWYKIQVQK